MFKRLALIHFVMLLPLVSYNLLKWKQFGSLKNKHTAIVLLTDQIKSFSFTEKENTATKEVYQDPEPNYLYNQIESMATSRDKQKILLIESKGSSSPFYQDKIESLARSICVDLKDLKTLLERVEQSHLKSQRAPHLIFNEFSLKKNTGEKNTLYDLNFKLTKREYKTKR